MAKKKTMEINTGLAKLDKIIGGFKGGDLIVVASRPSMGKTAFLHNIINHGHKAHVCVVLKADGLRPVLGLTLP